MNRERSQLRDQLIDEIEELQEDQLADLAEYVHKLQQQRQKRAGQGLDARGLELIYRCTECGYIQTRAETLPDHCPSCGTSKEAFVLVEED